MTGIVIDDLAAEFAALRCAGGFRLLLADPAWSFDNYSAKGEGKNPKAHYRCMAIEELCALPVELLAADDAALAVWCTWPLMPSWNRLIESWGFRYAGLLWEWIKFNPATGRYAFGPGYGTRKNLEPCLLATRGNPPLRDTGFDRYCNDLFCDRKRPEGVRSVRDFIEAMPLDAIRAPRREHSRKPEEQYTRLETLFDGPRIELFARTKRRGWTAWGNEVGKFGRAGA